MSWLRRKVVLRVTQHTGVTRLEEGSWNGIKTRVKVKESIYITVVVSIAILPASTRQQNTSTVIIYLDRPRGKICITPGENMHWNGPENGLMTIEFKE